jgi:hypothetical protein
MAGIEHRLLTQNTHNAWHTQNTKRYTKLHAHNTHSKHKQCIPNTHNIDSTRNTYQSHRAHTACTENIDVTNVSCRTHPWHTHSKHTTQHTQRASIAYTAPITQYKTHDRYAYMYSISNLRT